MTAPTFAIDAVPLNEGGGWDVTGPGLDEHPRFLVDARRAVAEAINAHRPCRMVIRSAGRVIVHEHFHELKQEARGMSRTWPAHRLPVVDGKVTPFNLFEPGDYCGPIEWDERSAVFFLLPIARDNEVPHFGARAFHHVASPPHTFRECPDGSLEIRASIGCRAIPSGEFYWHGFLDEGHVWREA